MANKKRDPKENREDLERIRNILRDIAEKLSKANDSIKKPRPDMAKTHNNKAEEAAEKLRLALEELKKRRREACHNQKNAALSGPGADSVKAKKKTDSADSKTGLPVYKGDFVSADEYTRLTNLPPITPEEIKNTDWDSMWDHLY